MSKKTKKKKKTQTTKSKKGTKIKNELKEEKVIELSSSKVEKEEKVSSNKKEPKVSKEKVVEVSKDSKIEDKVSTKKKDAKKDSLKKNEDTKGIKKEKVVKDPTSKVKKNSNKKSNTDKKSEIELKNKKSSEQVKKDKHHLIKDNFIYNVVIVTLMVFAIEVIFKLVSKFDVISYSSLRILISTFIISTIIVFLGSLTKRRWLRNTIILIYIFAYAIYNWLQLGFMNFLGVYISFNTSSQALAVLSYIMEFLSSFKYYYYLVYIPFILAFVYYIFLIRKIEYIKVKINVKDIIMVVLIAGMSGLYYLTLTLSSMQGEFQVKSNLKLFVNPDIPTVSVNQFGTVMFGLADFRAFLFPADEEEDVFLLDNLIQEVNANVTRKVSPVLTNLATSGEKSKYDKLNKYFASQKITDYNDHTGMFKDMNVVVVQIESGSWGLVNEKYFPNYYKMYSQGWNWDNYYSPRNSCATGNNEFSLMTGIYSIYNTCTTNTYRNNTYFESIFNLFNDADYSTTSMHNFVEWYYYRKISHKNMGSTYYGAEALKIKTSTYGEWPSDIELMEKAFKIILDEKNEGPWFSWITTVTSHQPYSNSSTYGDKYLKYFKGEGYSTTVARYMSKLKVVDEALGYMLKTLEDAGQLDNTVIVLVPDHYPYGLKEEQLKEMFDRGYDDYEKEREPFVIYNPSMEAQTFEHYTSYVDFLPTIANLLDINYDPRLYVGTDLFSEDHESLVIFPDGSWKNEYAFYDASKSKVKEYEKGHYSNEDIMAITNKANLKISMSTTAVKLNYFEYLGKEIEKYNKEQESKVTDE